MKLYIKFLISFLTLMFLFSCAQKTVEVKHINEIKEFKIAKIKDEYKAELLMNYKSDVKVFYGKEPYKLTILVPDCSVSSELLNFKYTDDNIKSVLIYKDRYGANVEILLNKDVRYKYNVKDNKVLLTFLPLTVEEKEIGKTLDYTAPLTEDILVGSKLLDIENSSDSSNLLFKIKLNGVVRYDYGYLDNDYLYVDLFDVKNVSEKKYLKYNKGIIRYVKIGEYYPPQKVRLLIKLIHPITVFAAQDRNYLILSNNFESLPKEQKYLVGIETISVKTFQSIIVKTTGRINFTKKIVNGNLLVIFDDDVKILNRVKNIINFSEKSPFKYLKIVNYEGKTAILIIPNGYEVYANVETAPEGILISGSFENFSKATVKFSKGLELLESREDKKKVSKIDLITLNIKDMDVREAIKLIYFGRKKNLVFGNGVSGKATLFVKDIPYTQALEIILKENNLVKIEDDNLVWILTKQRYSAMKAEEIKKIKEKEAIKKVEPLVTETVPVNFSEASAFTAIIKSVLSERGKLEINSRTNSFVITDIKSSIDKARELLKELDKKTPQVTIEARIVEVLDTNNLNLGIQWGGNYNVNSTSVNFPNTITINGNTGSTGISGSGYIVNLPVGTPAGALALSLGNLSRTFNLDVALSALESQNKVRTISSPRITTLNNQEAEIKSGGTAIIVPTGDNTETQEVDVGIKLKIKPHITQNGMVFLDIEVEKSSLGSVTANTATTEEKKAKTQVLLENGETTVIGGIYEDEKSEVYQGVPFLSKIPILGALFRAKSNTTTKKELLVFITPKIVE
ncbi:type IV pilus secretin PilQ [Deferribacter autotrophicus]|uniref:Type IV pilus secretin PilQ n=1 Tax=Deferribacter autotrophicus TaxID=500465 RepID=A0A5A8F2R7_9BACT|nr:type IV pilus secretin PilQ [Deferribacter autotrophicus]KAA0258425.1 type IV pilus secretin PilQ [Deferribacter autotrophicus]